MAIDAGTVKRLVRAALDEDLGSGDITTEWTVPEHQEAHAELIAKAEGVIAGIDVAAATFRTVDPAITFLPRVSDGSPVTSGEVVAELSGPARGILTGERTALNFLQRMSGIATETARFCAAVADTGARILDTRKTAPGLRLLDKYAVTVGGGHNHRMGLYDMVLLKENHVAAAGGVDAAVRAVRAQMQHSGRTVKLGIEVESLAQLNAAVDVGVDWILLDNMTAEAMRQAVARVRELGDARPFLEASGNVRIDNVRSIAETGVDAISIGALTHSVRALDLSLLFR
ncbi:MAG: carboxylating nicotinate-nucleotide diphosphorylase [Deltaproteobacteria bacterium]|nr:MAG: carboxylating nicotinate-nucleotide diphosphorylase [Deltaproteobacteria bacterium]